MGFEGGAVLRAAFREIGRSYALAGHPDGWPRRMFPLIQPAAFQISFIQAQVMAEFVEVGEADFVIESRRVTFSVVPNIIQEEDYLRGQHVHAGVLAMGGADEEAERIGFNVVGLQFRARGALVNQGQGLCRSAQLGRQ